MTGAPEADATPEAGTFRRLGHVPALDGLRGIAVLLVVFSHTPLLTVPGFSGVGPIDRFARGGFLGVDIFFVLSGFLITALLLREEGDRGRVGFGSFYLRRALRLLPALLLFLFAHAVYAQVTELPRENELKSIGAALAYMYNWFIVVDVNAPAAGLGHLWSLAIEEQFYLLWPAVLILFLGVRRNGNLVLAVLVTAIVAVALHRALVWEATTSWLYPFVRTDTRADSLLIGALLAAMWVRHRTPTRGLPIAAWISAAVLIVTISRADPEQAFVYRGGFTLVAVAVGVLILAAVDGRWSGNRLLSVAPLRLVGRVSYGLYLWHFAVFVAVVRYGSTWPVPVRLLVAFGLTAFFTAFSWHFVEQPALRWKRRLDRRAMPEVGSAPEVTGTAPAPESP